MEELVRIFLCSVPVDVYELEDYLTPMLLAVIHETLYRTDALLHQLKQWIHPWIKSCEVLGPLKDGWSHHCLSGVGYVFKLAF
jgi:hypothetical protein